MKEKIIGFIWQHLLLAVSLYVMTLGVAVCVRSAIGSSVISNLPYVFEQAGAHGLGVPQWRIGTYTIIVNFIFVVFQMLILRRDFEWVQLFQLVIGAFFGTLIDMNMLLTQWLVPTAFWQKAVTQVAGCTILALGITMEVRCGSVTMPGEGITIAIAKVSHRKFPKVKIAVDVTLVSLAVVFSYIFFGAWQWHITGVGTLFAMVYVGAAVRAFAKRMTWFDRVLCHRPGFRRYVYGLARYVKRLYMR